MAPIIRRQNYENFRGLDLKTSDLTKLRNFAKSCTNGEFSEGFSIRKRAGSHIIGQVGPFLRTYNYSFQDRITGETKQQLLAVNDFLWRYTEFTFIFGGGIGQSVYYTVTFHQASARFRFTLYVNGIAETLVHPVTGASNAYLDLGTGLEEPGSANYTSILDLTQAINATATFSFLGGPADCVYGRKDTTQNVVNPTVDAGHTFTAGAWSSVHDWATGIRRLQAVRILSTAATTVTFEPIFGDPTTLGARSLLDNQTIGDAAVSAATLYPAQSTPSTGGVFTLFFGCWKPVPFWTESELSNSSMSCSRAPFRTVYDNSTSQDTPLPHLETGNSVCYIFTGAQIPSTSAPRPHEFYPYKYDGIAAYRSGLPQPKRLARALNGAGVLTGDYRYKVMFDMYDGQGNLIESQPSEATDTLTTAAQQIRLTIPYIQYCVPDTDVHTVGAAGGPITTITLTVGFEFIVGDYVTLYDAVTAGLVSRRVISTNPGANTITIEGPGVTVALNQLIARNAHDGFRVATSSYSAAASSAIQTMNATEGVRAFEIGDRVWTYDGYSGTYVYRTIVSINYATNQITFDTAFNSVLNDRCSIIRVNIYRTTAGGNLYYLVARVPYRFVGAAGDFTYDDNAADTALGEQLLEPPIGYERDLPPRASIATQHQGLMVYSGIWEQPNTFAWNDPDGGLENAPLASNYSDVPSSVTGSIRAIGSDTEDRLAIFKERGYYDVSGDLASGLISLRTVREGDYGVSSQSCLVKANQQLIGVGPQGFISVSNGSLSNKIGFLIAPKIRTNTKINFHKASGFLDDSKNSAIFFIPYISGATDAQFSDSLGFCLDLENDEIWFDWSWDSSLIAPFSGGTSYSVNRTSSGVLTGTTTRCRIFASSVNDTAANLCGGVYRQLADAVGTNNYQDVNLAISFDWRAAWEHLDDPEFSKEFRRIRVYSFYSSGEEDFFVPCTITVDAYKDFYEAISRSSGSMSFATIAQTYRTLKIRSDQWKTIQFRFRNSVIGECPHITGYALLVADAYEKDDFSE